ncbi:bactofilin family protein [Thiohalorhabdus sp.]|uniref:bactofilin family protein n=1 Tax=Thiohalorhabdus sp. TaxID=3094134 RepID=UPI002FC3209A
MLHKKRKASTGGNLETMIGSGTSIQGDIAFEGGLRVDGTVEGTLSAPDGSGSRLVVSDQAEIRGEVQVPNVIINGRIIGDVRASERLELHGQCNVEGDLYYEVIQMEEGAGLTGTCCHISTTNHTTAPGQIPKAEKPDFQESGEYPASGESETGSGSRSKTEREVG